MFIPNIRQEQIIVACDFCQADVTLDTYSLKQVNSELLFAGWSLGQAGLHPGARYYHRCPDCQRKISVVQRG